MIEVKFYKDGEEYKPTPIEVAIMLIQKQEKRKAWKNPFLGILSNMKEKKEEDLIEFETEMFLPFELEEIAKHIQVYTKKYECRIQEAEEGDGNNE